jgi:hypothetical protein
MLDQNQTSNSRVLQQGYLTLLVQNADQTNQNWMIKYVEVTERGLRFRKSHTVKFENELLFNRGTLFMVQLFNSDQQLMSIGGENRNHVFQVQHGMLSWVMQASSTEDMHTWMFNINKAASEYLNVDSCDQSDRRVDRASTMVHPPPEVLRSPPGRTVTNKKKGFWQRTKNPTKGFGNELQESLLGDDGGHEMTFMGEDR